MNDSLRTELLDRHLDHAFDELAGRAEPPARERQILQRIAAATAPAPRRIDRLVAALLVVGIGVTAALALWQGDRTDAARDPLAYASRTDTSPPASNAARAPAKHAPGTDPADLRATRSAEAMLQAERRLATILSDGTLPSSVTVLPFASLRGWTYTEGLQGMPLDVHALDGATVAMVGFMLPMNEATGMTKFLFVESLWSCCYGVPPDIHAIVRCEMAPGQTADHSFEPVLIVGTFAVSETREGGYCTDIYQLHVGGITVLH